ncbi:MAG: RNA methyltransferase [Candidatus Poseidoniaceae archaeon]|nr:RNA methyltransferase [Candidatus Poseidoniaceae archaeon]
MGQRSDIPLPTDAYRLTVILVGTSHPGNLGAVCRGMLNHGFDRLRLVNPQCDIDDEARSRAKHAGRILDNATVHTTLEEAVSDTTLVVGTSGKRELGRKTVFRHFLYPWDLASRLEDGEGHVALVFGEEGKGLSHEDLDRCDMLATLPTWEGYPIANLSHAVTLFLYELHRTRVLNRQGSDQALPDVVPINVRNEPGLRRAYRESIEQFADVLPGLEERRMSVRQVLIRQAAKGGASDEELTRLIGAYLDATTALQRVAGDESWSKHRRRRLPSSEDD